MVGTYNVCVVAVIDGVMVRLTWKAVRIRRNVQKILVPNDVHVTVVQVVESIVGWNGGGNYPKADVTVLYHIDVLEDLHYT